MSSSKKIDIICIAMAVLALVITLLFMNGKALGLKTVVDEDAEENSDLVYFTKNDLNGNWNTSVATKIVLKDDKVKIAGSGAIVKNGNVVINSGGHYVVNGSLTDGSIIIDAKSGAKVWLLFDGVEINRNDDACIKVSNADKVFLTLAEDSQNSLTSGAVYNEEALAEGVDGAIYSHDDFTINGSGSLSVKADYKHGIAVNDALVITGGSITVSAVSGAIHANEKRAAAIRRAAFRRHALRHHLVQHPLLHPHRMLAQRRSLLYLRIRHYHVQGRCRYRTPHRSRQPILRHVDGCRRGL